ncbi:hypothetical protein [uncultured Acetobacteroides sp.]|uniref:hypothetical protein n=1 Tax=uncultured Acetobacteroides sp. TaxID=1760811 RepID=UPI0029F56AEF|nr:hypothetical protein [uncultured Acetobacteroides sp.]
MRALVPENPDKKGKLGDAILTKHAADGPESIIVHLVKDDIKESIDNLNALSRRADELRREAEATYALRNLESKKVDKFIRSVRDVVNATFRDQPKKLTEYGFEVNEAKPKAKAEKKAKPDKDE